MIFKINYNTHLTILKNNKSKNYLVTLAIGPKYFDEWKKYCSNSWIKYCKKNNLGLVVIIKNLVERKSKFWKKPTWQRLLVSKYIKNSNLKIENICVLDSDIFINEHAPNIFSKSNLKKISVVNFFKNLPFKRSDYEIRMRLVHLRRLFLDKSYPLRSSLTANPKEIFSNYKLRINIDNYFCAGVMVYNVKKYQNFFEKIYLKYCEAKNLKKFIGVEIPLNYEVLSKKKPFWLDYKFQTIWLFELSDKYSFIYRIKKYRSEIIKYCAEEIILNSYFLHFPGTLSDSNNTWKIKNFFKDKKLKKLNKLLNIKGKRLKPKFRK